MQKLETKDEFALRPRGKLRTLAGENTVCIQNGCAAHAVGMRAA